MTRKQIDWDLIERLYVANQLTIRQIAKECGVSDAAIRKRAKVNGWERDLSGPIKARTQAKIAMAEVAAIASLAAQEKVASRSAELTAEAIEHASDIAAGIVVKHRKSLQEANQQIDQLGSQLDTMIAEVTDLRTLEIAVRAHKNLTDARAKVIVLERQAFGLDEKDSSQNDDLSHLTDADLLTLAEELAAQIGFKSAQS